MMRTVAVIYWILLGSLGAAALCGAMGIVDFYPSARLGALVTLAGGLAGAMFALQGQPAAHLKAGTRALLGAVVGWVAYSAPSFALYLARPDLPAASRFGAPLLLLVMLIGAAIATGFRSASRAQRTTDGIVRDLPKPPWGAA